MTMRRYLRHIHVDHYGGLADREVGPFSPGMNVVFGPNEAGKSTLASLVGGVLFGWEEASGVRNTYRPAHGGRGGRLEMAGVPGVSGVPVALGASGAFPASELARSEESATGDFSVVNDIDRATYDTLFSLRADELRSLRASPDVTARLLSAGSGTGASPAAAFAEVERRIADATADVLRLEEQLEEKRQQVKEESGRVELMMQESRELRELEESRATTARRIDALNAEVEDLAAARAELAAIDQRIGQCQDELAALRDELDGLSEADGPVSAGFDERLLALDSASDRVLRDRLEELAETREKLERVADAAKENSATSTAAYEALMELSEEDVAAGQSLRSRTSQAVVSVLLPIAFIAAGVPLFVHGREIASLSFTALGVGLIVIAAFLAAAAFVVLFRGPRDGSALELRRQDAQWVMLQDRKKRDASQREKADFEQALDRFFHEVGLSAANGSIRQARTLLDEAAALRSHIAAARQKASSLDLRIRASEKELAGLLSDRSRVLGAAGFSQDGSIRDLDASARLRAGQRDALLEAASDMNRRFGELNRTLASARDDRTFDRLKLEYYEVRTRLRERKHELVELLLAKRMLERGITVWESQGQPEVYAQASRLLAMITGGAWVGVSASATGSLVALAADGSSRDPRHLSLGTCQQLYLALRIALLIVADDVGRDVPVLADDILVNFDAARRDGAACALRELACVRQVILFTCHRDIAALFPEATRIDL